MTEDEKKEIVQNVLFEIRRGSKEIGQLPNAEAFSELDFIELSGARKVSVRTMAQYMFHLFFDTYMGQHYLSSEHDDIAHGNIDFKKGITAGEFIDSMAAGRGTAIFPDGRIQTDRIEVRQSMEIMELIVNRLSAIEGDQIFTESDIIESIDDNGYASYGLHLKSKWKGYTTAQVSGNIVRGIYNTFSKGKGTYFSSWMRVNYADNANNYIEVSLFPDSEVPGGRNYPPCELMQIGRWGNQSPSEKEKQSSIYLSSDKQRISFLGDVTTPELADPNYKLILGKYPNIREVKKLGLEGDYGLYAKTVLCKRLHQIDWNGEIVPNQVLRGEWSEEVAKSDLPYRYQYIVPKKDGTEDGGKVTEPTNPDNPALKDEKRTILEEHVVYHFGCLWGCRVDGTIQEPRWNTPDWILLEGDNKYKVEIDSTQGKTFVIPNIDTELKITVTHANRDITKEIIESEFTTISWNRITGNAELDAAWTPTTQGVKGETLVLADKDMGEGWGKDYMKVQFEVTVNIPSAKGDVEIKKVI